MIRSRDLVIGEPYHPVVEPPVRRPLADDTPLEIEQVQIDIWRRMSQEEEAQLVTSLCRGVLEAAAEGVRWRHPHASPREQFLRLAIFRLGHDLAVEAFPDAASLP